MNSPSPSPFVVSYCRRVRVFLRQRRSALASYLHSDISIQTYTDFAQNRGRYQVGNTSALLQYLNTGGVVIPYTGGQESEHVYNMPDFQAKPTRIFCRYRHKFYCLGATRWNGLDNHIFRTQRWLRKRNRIYRNRICG